MPSAIEGCVVLASLDGTYRQHAFDNFAARRWSARTRSSLGVTSVQKNGSPPLSITEAVIVHLIILPSVLVLPPGTAGLYCTLLPLARALFAISSAMS